MPKVVRFARPDAGSISATRRVRRASGPPLYRQMCDAVDRMAMALPLGDEGPLPPVGELIARFRVSGGMDVPAPTVPTTVVRAYG